MTYVAEPFPSFSPGLNLRDKTDVTESTQAIDLMNVTFSEQGSIRQRDGYAGFRFGQGAQNLAPFYTSAGLNQLLAGTDTTVVALDSSGGTIGSATSLVAGNNFSFVRFAAPGVEYAYAGNGYNVLQRWDGANWTAPTATVDGSGGGVMPKPSTMAVMPVSNRLVAGGFGTTTGGPGSATTNPSTVYFSGDDTTVSPENWKTANYIQVTPGDGERVQAIIAWKNLVFVFKETKFAVVYGESVDQSGEPIFNYRVVDARVGAVGPRAVTADENGVYFADRHGVYRTTGSTPERVSDLIDPLFLGNPSAFFLGGSADPTKWANVAMWTHDRRVYLSYSPLTNIVEAQPTGPYWNVERWGGTTWLAGTSPGTTGENNRTLVFDPRFEWWALYDLPASCGASYRIVSQNELIFSDGFNIYRSAPGYTSDLGDPIESRWRSGWNDYGLTAIKRIRETKLWGTGKVYLAISPDFNTNVGTLDLCDFTRTTDVNWNTSSWGGTTWGGAQAGLTPVLRRRAVRGTVFSTLLYSNIGEPWALSRMAHHLASQRIVSPREQVADLS